VCGCSSFDPGSLTENSIGNKGAQHIGEALKENTTLTVLECVPASPSIAKCARFVVSKVADARDCSLFDHRQA
jgi:hypothetical protein